MMDGARIQMFPDLMADRHWSLKSEGFAILFVDGQVNACAVFEKWGVLELVELGEHIDQVGLKTEMKVIGGSRFVHTLRSWARRKGVKIIKDVVRNGAFEILFSACDKVFKINMDESGDERLESSKKIEKPKNDNVRVEPLRIETSKTEEKKMSAVERLRLNPILNRVGKDSKSEPLNKIFEKVQSFRQAEKASADSTGPLSIQLDKPVKPVVDRTIKVLIVDDSVTIRKILASMMKRDPTIEVVGMLDRPSLVEPFLEKNKVDVMTLDIHMPEMDGVSLLRKIFPRFQIPTIMISSITKEDGPYVLDALETGAFDYIQKPSFQDIPNLGPIVLERIHQATSANVRRPNGETKAGRYQRVTEKWLGKQEAFVLIGASTGGTEALSAIFRQFPDEIPPILVVQHIPPVFSKAFADRLNSMFKFEVREAQDGDVVRPNRILIAPGGKHLGVVKKGDHFVAKVTEEPPVNRHRPSVDYLFKSAAEAGMLPAVGVILTGMGGDGARGLLSLRQAGAKTLGQDEASCIVYGMPKVAAELGALEEVVPLSEMGHRIFDSLKKVASDKKAG